MSLGTRLFVLICPALLPADDPDEPDYHTTLGLGNKKSASLDEIRRAYRAKSLDLHPDRLAYRRETNTEQVSEEYKRVQEAYAVLSDPQQRKKYAAVGYSPARFRFFTQGGGVASHPVALLENVAKASCADKTKLLLLISILLCLILLQPILIAAKVNAEVEGCSTHDEDPTDDECKPKKLQDTKWVVLLIPFWIMQGLAICFWTLLVVFLREEASQRTRLIVTWLEQVAWFVGCFWLAVAWDKEDRQDVQWHVQAIPFYVAMVCKSVGARLSQIHLRQEQDKMASPEFVQATEDTHLSEMTEEQLLELNKRYVIITVDPHHVAAEMAMRAALNDGNNEDNNNNNNITRLSDEEMEEIKVTTSPEYLEHEHMIRQRQSGVVEPIVFGITFIALVAARVENQITASWWLVFLPILVPLGFRFLSVCCMSLCLPLLQFSEELEKMAEAAEQAAEEEEAAALQQQQQQQAEDEAVADLDNVVDVETGGVAQNDAQQVDSKKQGEGEGQDKSSDKKDTAVPKTEKAAKVRPATTETVEPKQGDNVVESTPSPIEKGAVDESTEQTEKVDTKEDEGEPEIEFNEETFHEWYSSHMQAEQSAMEARAKAQSACCWFCFQLVILCLIIGKVEQDYDNADGSAGYNAFWILFPVFVVMGVILCCCSCLIYGAGASTLEGLAEQDRPLDEENPTQGAASAGESNASSPIIIVPQPVQSTDHISTTSENKPTGGTAPENGTPSSTDQPAGESKAETSVEGLEVKKTEEIGGDMDDLD